MTSAIPPQKPGKFRLAKFGLKAGEVESVSPEFRNISSRRAWVLAVTAVLFIIFLLTLRTRDDPPIMPPYVSAGAGTLSQAM